MAQASWKSHLRDFGPLPLFPQACWFQDLQFWHFWLPVLGFPGWQAQTRLQTGIGTDLVLVSHSTSRTLCSPEVPGQENVIVQDSRPEGCPFKFLCSPGWEKNT